MKCKDGGSYFNNNQKYRLLEIEKNFSYFIPEIPNFSIWDFSENAQCSVGAFFLRILIGFNY